VEDVVGRTEEDCGRSVETPPRRGLRLLRRQSGSTRSGDSGALRQRTAASAVNGRCRDVDGRPVTPPYTAFSVFAVCCGKRGTTPRVVTHLVDDDARPSL